MCKLVPTYTKRSVLNVANIPLYGIFFVHSYDYKHERIILVLLPSLVVHPPII